MENFSSPRCPITGTPCGTPAPPTEGMTAKQHLEKAGDLLRTVERIPTGSTSRYLFSADTHIRLAAEMRQSGVTSA